MSVFRRNSIFANSKRYLKSIQINPTQGIYNCYFFLNEKPFNYDNFRIEYRFIPISFNSYFGAISTSALDNNKESWFVTNSYRFRMLGINATMPCSFKMNVQHTLIIDRKDGVITFTFDEEQIGSYSTSVKLNERVAIPRLTIPNVKILGFDISINEEQVASYTPFYDGKEYTLINKINSQYPQKFNSVYAAEELD